MPKFKKKDIDSMPNYLIESVVDDPNIGFNLVSNVADPAIEIKGFCFNREDSENMLVELEGFSFARNGIVPPCHENCKCKIEDGKWKFSKDENSPCELCQENKKEYEWFNEFSFKAVTGDQMRIVGPALVPNKRIVRIDEKTKQPYTIEFTEQCIRDLVDKFNSRGNNHKINDNHTKEMVNAFISNNWIVEDTYHDRSYLYGYRLPKGSWVIENKYLDKDYWENDIKKLGKSGFSVEGVFALKPEALRSEQSGTKDMNQIIDELTDEEVQDILKFVKNIK